LTPNRKQPHAGGRTDLHLERIIRVLRDHAMVVVSGTKLAQEIGTSCSEVWRLVQQLRSLGVQIAGHPGVGYRLETVPDLLLSDALDPLIQGTIFAGRIQHYFRVNSTNVVAMQEAQAGEPEGAVYFAEEQTAGHGRGGHDWHSARSTGLYLSVILRPAMAPADALALSLMAGLATAAAVEEVAGVKADLRWPNDLLLPHPGVPAAETGVPGAPGFGALGWADAAPQRKFCGILTELNAEVTRVRFAVTGIGINVNQEQFPAELAGLATSLRIETGRAWSRVELAAALLQSLDREYRRFTAPAAPADAGAELGRHRNLFRRFEQASSYARGRRVEVEEEGGYTGTTAGLNGQGFLQVRTDDGILKTVLNGGVRAIE
jgi:BirA family biotin operon repressor/biotin-[acetyl-CoA-carboxylase] ligase